MPEVFAKFCSPLREITRQKETKIEGETIAQILDGLVIKYGKPLKAELFQEDGRIKPFFIISVNGRTVNLPEGLGTRLKEGDTIEIFLAVAGG